MTDPEAFFESLRAMAARRPLPLDDPEAEQAMDDAIAAARPRTRARFQQLLEIHDASAWAAFLEQEISPGLETFGAVIEVVARTRAEFETFARLSEAFEGSVASAFADNVDSEDAGNSEVSQVANAMLNDGWFTPADVELLAAQTEEVTAEAIAKILEHDIGTARRQELASRLHLATLKLLLS